MPYLNKTAKTDDYIILPNPEHPQSDFRQNNKGEINITGTTNHGGGVKARVGLLRGSGKSGDIDYLFDNSKFTEETAKEWLASYKEKSIMKTSLLNKKFQFTMPLIKDYRDDNGFLHIELGLSTTEEDLQGDEMTDKALEGMVKELKNMSIVVNDGHNHRLKDLIGPTTDAWIEGNIMKVDLLVREMWEKEIQDLLNSNTPLGGSIEGRATKTITAKREGLNKELIDGVKLRGAALTDIPAAWNLRGSARKSKKCIGSMCSQIMKSLEKDNLEVKNVKKSIINLDEAYESIKNEVNEALDNKYGKQMDGGWISRPCYVQYTLPESVVIRTDDGDLYQIPYTLGKGDNEDTTLGVPIPATPQIITKALENAKWMIKSEKPRNGGDNLTKTTDNIPEGMDEKFVDKIKALPQDGKQFLKGLLGSETPSKDPEGGGNLTSATGGEPMKKELLSKDDVQKMFDDRDAKFEKTLKEKDEKIETLEKTINKREDTILKKDHEKLVNKALDLHKKLHPTPDGETDINEEGLMESIKKDYSDIFTEEEIEKDPGTCIKTAIKGMEIALSKYPDGDVPNLNDNTIEKHATKYAEEAEELRKDLDKQGRE